MHEGRRAPDEVALNMRHQTCRAVVDHLHSRGRIVRVDAAVDGGLVPVKPDPGDERRSGEPCDPYKWTRGHMYVPFRST